MKRNLLICLIALTFSAICSASPLSMLDKRLNNPPPRIIRTCCSFGVKVKMSVIPFVKYSDISGPELIGPHKFLGSRQEGNGIIYTRKGGFVDIGHVRDQADWTAFLYNLIIKNKSKNQSLVQLKLGYEGGLKTLNVNIPNQLSNEDIMVIAGRIAYDLSVWHEIGTWNGTSLVPLLPEKYSAFSIEDGFSNLLGIRLGIEALKSDLPYEEAMTELVKRELVVLDALPSKSETFKAMMEVEGDWWSLRERLPSKNLMKKREFNLYPCITPVLLHGEELAESTLCLPSMSGYEDPNDYYRIHILINHKFPVKEIFSDNHKKIITQLDFPSLIKYAAEESRKYFDDVVYKPYPLRKKVKV
jgi:hypothetical protein